MSVAQRTETMHPLGGAELAMKAHPEVAERLGVALEQTQEALSQVQRIAVEEIRIGLQASDHVEAAEREMRGALRQLVLAERELRARSLLRTSLDRRIIVTGEDRDDEEVATGLENRRAALHELAPPTELG